MTRERVESASCGVLVGITVAWKLIAAALAIRHGIDLWLPVVLISAVVAIVGFAATYGSRVCTGLLVLHAITGVIGHARLIRQARLFGSDMLPQLWAGLTISIVTAVGFLAYLLVLDRRVRPRSLATSIYEAFAKRNVASGGENSGQTATDEPPQTFGR